MKCYFCVREHLEGDQLEPNEAVTEYKGITVCGRRDHLDLAVEAADG